MTTTQNPAKWIVCGSLSLLPIFVLACIVHTKFDLIHDDENLGVRTFEQLYAAFHFYESTSRATHPNLADPKTRNKFLVRYGSVDLAQILTPPTSQELIDKKTNPTKQKYWLAPVYNPNLNDPHYNFDYADVIAYSPVYTQVWTGPSVQKYVVLRYSGSISELSPEEFEQSKDDIESWKAPRLR